LAEEVIDLDIGLGREAYSAGIPVINEDGRPFRLRMKGAGDAADVVAVAQHQEGEEGDHRMLQGMDGPHEMVFFPLAMLHQFRGEG
jgi:hypothetical protein